MSTKPPRLVTTYWIDTADHLPGEQITVLAVTRSRQVILAHRVHGKWWTRSFVPLDDVIAWCDLPEPPEPPKQ